jgi:hypothetical protein
MKGDIQEMKVVEVMDAIIKLIKENREIIIKYEEKGEDNRYFRGVNQGLQLAFDLVKQIDLRESSTH